MELGGHLNNPADDCQVQLEYKNRLTWKRFLSFLQWTGPISI